MDWVHCNNCYVQPGDVENTKFSITNCGHIYCHECLQANQSGECRLCHIKYITIPLSSNMNSEVEVYFHDALAKLKKQLKILEFQHGHRVRLFAHNRERLRGLMSIKKENYSMIEEIRKFKHENARLRDELVDLKKDFLELRKKYDTNSNSDQQISSQRSCLPSMSQIMSKEMRSPGFSTRHPFNSSNTQIEGNFISNLKRPSESNFFLMSESKPRKNERAFTTPDLPRFPGSYRSQKISTPDMNTPPTPEAIIREFNQRDPLQRRVKLPGSRSGPSPATRIGFHSLTLSRSTSTPKNETTTTKYLKYFK